MNRTYLYMAFFLLGGITISAQTIFGKWKTVDSETGKTESIVEVYEKDGFAYAKILEILDPKDKDKTCIYCKGTEKNKPIEGLVIMKRLKKKGDEWSGGKILDPKNGKKYSCYIKLVTNNKLKLRGYIGFALIGRTEYWYRN